MSSCQQCGAAVPEGAAFCPSCGSRAGAGASAGAPPMAPDRWRTGSPMSASEVRTWAMAAHLTALAGGFVGGLASFVGPLVVWVVKRDEDPFVADHAREALNFNLLIFALVVIGFLLSLFTFGFGLALVIPLGLVVALFWLIVTIQATMAASGGRRYRYPLNVRWVR